MTQMVLEKVENGCIKTLIRSVEEQILLGNEVRANYKRGDKILLTGLVGRNSSYGQVQAEFYSIHEKGRFINVYIEGNLFQESILCVGSISIEKILEDDKPGEFIFRPIPKLV